MKAVKPTGTLVTVNHVGLLRTLTESGGNPVRAGPYVRTDRVLTVGDGDLSFSVSLASLVGPATLTATTYDKKHEMTKKYPGSAQSASLLSGELKAAVIHCVDCRGLEKDDRVAARGPYNKIVFNFPHVGGSTAADVAANQDLIRDFLISAGRLLLATEATGEVHISLRNTPFYKGWGLEGIAREIGYKLAREEPFEATFIGYEAKRTHPAVRPAPSIEGNATRYVFDLRKSGKVLRSVLERIDKHLGKGDAVAAAASAAEAEAEAVKTERLDRKSEGKRAREREAEAEAEADQPKRKKLAGGGDPGTDAPRQICELCGVEMLSLESHIKTPWHQRKADKMKRKTQGSKEEEGKKEAGKKEAGKAAVVAAPAKVKKVAKDSPSGKKEKKM
jgi:hypothetical protein